jgi:hypothetical protein
VIEHDSRAVSALLSERGILLNRLDVRDGSLVIGLAEPPTIEVYLYVNAIAEVLGLKGAWVSYRGEVFKLEVE